MTKKKRKTRNLTHIAEKFAISLINEANGVRLNKARPPGEEESENPISFRDRRALLDSITKLLISQKESEDDGAEDGITSFMENLNDGDGGKTERGAPKPDGSDEV